MGRDVRVTPPPAMGALNAKPTNGASGNEPPTPQELISMQQVEIRTLKRDLKELGDTCSLITEVALGMLRMLCDAGMASEANEVTVPKWLHEQLRGASIQLQNESNGIKVRLVEVDDGG